jgi:DNA-binding transcriptional LysR family regulator
VIEMVRVNRGVSVLSRWALPAALDHPELRLLRVTRGGLSVRWHAAMRKSHPRSGAAYALVQALRAELSSGGAG